MLPFTQTVPPPERLIVVPLEVNVLVLVPSVTVKRVLVSELGMFTKKLSPRRPDVESSPLVVPRS